MGQPAVTKFLRSYWLEFALALSGLCCLALAGSSWWRFHQFQTSQADAYTTPSLPITRPASLSPVLLRGQPVGRLNVPRLRLSSVIVEGVEADSLDLGVGHMSDSAPLGGIGNIVLAGHRDTALWPLRNLHQGDRVELISSRRSVYTVRSLTIVDPSDVALLRPTAESLLTIVTCYPFRHVGPAPKRLIIQATPSQKGASPLPVPHPTE